MGCEINQFSWEILLSGWPQSEKWMTHEGRKEESDTWTMNPSEPFSQNLSENTLWCISKRPVYVRNRKTTKEVLLVRLGRKKPIVGKASKGRNILKISNAGSFQLDSTPQTLQKNKREPEQTERRWEHLKL